MSVADDGTPLILQEKNTPTKTEIEKLISVIAEKLPPIVRRNLYWSV